MHPTKPIHLDPTPIHVFCPPAFLPQEQERKLTLLPLLLYFPADAGRCGQVLPGGQAGPAALGDLLRGGDALHRQEGGGGEGGAAEAGTGKGRGLRAHHSRVWAAAEVRLHFLFFVLTQVFL